jgi:hypothetical protein
MRILGCAIGILSVVCAAVPADAQRRDRTIIASAVGKDGSAVASLTPEDVLVQEDGVTREVLRVTRVTEPMQLAILVDNSIAADAHISNFREGLKAFVRELGDQHQISIETYAERPTLLTSFSTDRAEIDKAIHRIFVQSNAGAYLLDAVDETTRGFIKRESPRPVIVVIGTEGVEFSNLTDEQVLEQVRRSGAQLHVLQMLDGDSDFSDEERYRNLLVDRGTRETGGRRETLVTSLSLPSILRSLASELNGQFNVVYSRPESLIPPRKVTIASTRPGLIVRGSPAKASN